MDLDFSNINGMVCDRFLKCNRVGQYVNYLEGLRLERLFITSNLNCWLS